MLRRALILAGLLAILAAAAPAWAAAGRAYVINTSSEDATLLASVSVASAPAGALRASVDGGPAVPAAALDGRVWFALPLARLATAAVTIEQGDAPPQITVTETPDGRIVATPAGEYVFGPGGLREVRIGKTALALPASVDGAGETRLAWARGAAAVLETLRAGAVVAARWTVFGDGSVRVEVPAGTFRLPLPARGYEGRRFGPVKPDLGYHVMTVPTPLDEPFVSVVFNDVRFAAPLEWAAHLAEGRGAGLAMQGEAGAAYLPHGVLRPQGKWPPRDGWPRRAEASLDFAALDGTPAVAWLRAAADLEAVKAWACVRRAALVLVDAPGGAFEGLVPGGRVRIADSNGNGRPDLAGDRWTFSRAGRETAGLVYLPAAEDPRGEGNAIHLFADRDADGRMDAADWGRPVWRLADRNRDGRFWRGNLLEGGRLEQDAVYHRAAGSPDGRLWDRQVFALDLDGDGDQDVSVIKDEYNYSEGGSGPGTAANQAGVKFDFGDRDFAIVCLADLAAGRVRLARIDYDDGYFFAGKADASSLCGNAQEDGVWRLGEEHMEYEGFAPHPAAGHLWTFAGRLRRVVMGGLAGGNWKVGFGFHERSIVAASHPRTITYRDPWGNGLTLVSLIKPAAWDGRDLPYRAVLGRRDYVPQGAWAWAVGQTAASHVVLNPPRSWGVTSCEAYVEATEPDSRTEWARDGRTTFVLYYSPLARGLHHRGIHKGESRDGRLVYWDEDADGVVDHYVVDADGAGVFDRRLRYDRAAGRVWLSERGRTLSWPEKLEFPEAKFALENFERIEELYTMGRDEPPLAVAASITAAGHLAGYQPLMPAREDSETWPRRRVLVPRGLTGRQTLASDVEFGLKAMMPLFARHDLDVALGDMGDLDGADIVLVQGLAREPTAEEVAALRGWVRRGGTLWVSLTETDDAAVARAAALLAGVWSELRFGPETLDHRFRCRRIPDQGNVDGDVAEERVPAVENRASRFQAEGDLLRDCEYVNFRAREVQGGRAVLAWDRTPLVAEQACGQGRVAASGGAFLTHALFWDKVHTYIDASNECLADRLLAWLCRKEGGGR
jgi:hypothetical protein